MEKAALVLSKLSSAQGVRDEQPNVDLGQSLAKAQDTEAIRILVQAAMSGKKAVRRDAIKALYEAGNISPELLVPYYTDFITLLEDKDNRMQWGGMTALECVSKAEPEKVYPQLSSVVRAAEKGSVITRDHAVKILENIGTKTPHREEAFLVLNEILLSCPVNQLPNYAERAFSLVGPKEEKRLLATLQLRLPDVETAPKQRRVRKIMEKLSN